MQDAIIAFDVGRIVERREMVSPRLNSSPLQATSGASEEAWTNRFFHIERLNECLSFP